MAKITFKPSLFGCKLQQRSSKINNTWSLPNNRRIYKHLEILITQEDLLPLSSSSLLDRARIFETIQPFPELKTVTLVMGMKRQTDVEELCLAQELSDLQAGLHEFLARTSGPCRRVPVLEVQWLFPVEGGCWPDFGALYDIE